jgi:hypothetical protein
MLQSIYYLYFSTIRYSRIFAGYFHWYFACKYADKRSRRWKAKWDQSGRKQGVFPYTDTTLMVCSQGELRLWQKKKLIKNNKNPKRLIKKAYYESL